MQIIPLNPVASQFLTVSLNGQDCAILVYQKTTGLFLDLTANQLPIITGVICLNLNVLVRSAYVGFSGDLSFNDTQGSSDPYYLGLGSRYQLIYLEAADLVGARVA